MRIVHWFRRDLRMADNTARVAFMLDCLREQGVLLQEMSSRLIVRRGKPDSNLIYLQIAP